MHKIFIILCLHDRYPSLLAVSAEAILSILFAFKLFVSLKMYCVFWNNFFFFFWPHFRAYRILFLQQGIKPVPFAVKVWSFIHWTSREVPSVTIFINCFFLLIKSINLWCVFGLYKVLTYFFGGRSFKSIELLVHFLRMAQHTIVFIYHNLPLYYWCIFTLFSVFFNFTLSL